ncbi:unnamed protein product [Arctogadus glacialis]
MCSVPRILRLGYFHHCSAEDSSKLPHSPFTSLSLYLSSMHRRISRQGRCARDFRRDDCSVDKGHPGVPNPGSSQSTAVGNRETHRRQRSGMEL